MSFALPSSVRTFVHEHDDLPAFHAAYLLSAFCAAIFFDAGALLVLIALHMSFDVCKYRNREHLSWIGTMKATVRESVTDVALVALTLTFVVYLHHAIDFVGAFAGFLRGEVVMLRVFSTVLPQFFLSKRLLDVPLNGHPQFLAAPRHLAAFSLLELTSMGSLTFCAFLLAVASFLLPMTVGEETSIIGGHLSL